MLLVDDPGLVREGLLALFRSVEGTETAVADAKAAKRMAERRSPEVVLVRLGVVPGGQLQAVRSVLAQCPTTGLILLDEIVRPAHVCAALTLGVGGYWTLGASFEQLTRAVRRVASGGQSFCPASRKHVARLRNHLPPHPPPEGPGVWQLSQRECEVLVLLAGGLSVKECAGRLGLAANTIDNHKARMMKKLGVRKVVDLVRLAIRGGLIEA